MLSGSDVKSFDDWQRNSYNLLQDLKHTQAQPETQRTSHLSGWRIIKWWWTTTLVDHGLFDLDLLGTLYTIVV